MTFYITALCGSLRQASINRTLLNAARHVASPHNATIHLFDGLGHLPIFNPDNEDTDDGNVAAFRAALHRADAVLIASPEYAHGVTGVIKNALDWVVASGEFMQKPVACLSRATIAQAALIETISTMDARIVTDACITIPLNGKNFGVDDVVQDTSSRDLLDRALGNLTAAIPTDDISKVI
ncbi:NADPH-dependent FMN reductase [Thalassospira sp.]|uniref:NADPH-dependent FMN reductase n=1 Tax=Thalassospira sp. TaxID=1912094 RepID=UPI001AFD208C|nr:NADPH-dependent FMN reductase [Thalassospira sp.]MBO6807410.1 NAD(P)H-dependent oxidoreductase [Thalassospira sp.]MBO6839935.1 NAD(P)H-dependent oxidoreductase [Thalassospira sp.]